MSAPQGAPATPRFAYLGTSPFAVAVLDGLLAAGLRPALVVTPPDRPRGRGRRLAPPPVAARAAELGLPLHQTADASSPQALAELEAAGVEVGAVCAFGQILRAELLARYELLNVHPSLLPRWRGAAPIERAIMAGDERTGVAVMKVVEELDAGPIALREEVAIGPDEDFGSLATRLAELGGALLARALRARAAGELDFTPQAADGVSYAEKIEPAERRLDPARPAAELARRVRALTPHVGAYLELEGGERLGVTRARAAPGEGAAPGELRERDGLLVLGCGQGELEIAAVRPPGKGTMESAAYLRGHELPRAAARP